MKELKYVRSESDLNRKPDFIHQSLGSKDAEKQKFVQGIISEADKKTGAPRFLVSKKNLDRSGNNSPIISTKNTPSKYCELKKEHNEGVRRDYEHLTVPILKPFTGSIPSGVEVTSRVTPISSPRNERWPQPVKKMYSPVRTFKRE